jgi:hypothetical protein
MRSLTHEEFEREAGDAFRRVFKSTNPVGTPFTEAMSRRAILLNMGTFMLDADQFAALSAAAQSVGDHGFYQTMTERATSAWRDLRTGTVGSAIGSEARPLEGTEPPPFAGHVNIEQVDVGPQDWYFEVWDTSYHDNRRASTLENALVSPSGRWGILFSQADQFLVGGEGEFVDEFLDLCPGDRQSVVDWLYHVRFGPGSRHRQGSDPPWLAESLRHVYGEDEAARLLDETAVEP